MIIQRKTTNNEILKEDRRAIVRKKTWFTMNVSSGANGRKGPKKDEANIVLFWLSYSNFFPSHQC